MMKATEAIYVALLDEGMEVWRPVEAFHERDSIYRISDAESPDDEIWEFPPGSWSSVSGESCPKDRVS
jgi:hypothetical protein